MNNYFKFKQFTIYQDKCAMKVGTDGVLLGAWVNIKNAQKILDIGTGTGLIAIMLAQRSEATIEAIEIDNYAYKQACENISNCPWNKRINPVLISFQKYYTTTSNQFDLVVCNPPFFRNSIKTNDKLRNLARHNDMLPNTHLINGSSGLLTSNGRLAVIMPHAEGCVFIAEAARYSMFCIRKTNVKTKPASATKRLLLEFSKKPEKCIEDFLVIGTKTSQKYSEQYLQQTKDFYLLF